MRQDNAIKTPETHPDHHTVGHYFGGYDYQAKATTIYFCDSYDPRIGYWLTNLSNPEDRKSVSEAAIGRTFHEAHDQGESWWVQTWNVRVPKAPAAAIQNQLTCNEKDANMGTIDSEDQWQAWRIGRDCRREGYSLGAAVQRLEATFPQPEQRPFFDAGFSGQDCPAATAPNPQ